MVVLIGSLCFSGLILCRSHGVNYNLCEPMNTVASSSPEDSIYSTVLSSGVTLFPPHCSVILGRGMMEVSDLGLEVSHFSAVSNSQVCTDCCPLQKAASLATDESSTHMQKAVCPHNHLENRNSGFNHCRRASL